MKENFMYLKPKEIISYADSNITIQKQLEVIIGNMVKLNPFIDEYEQMAVVFMKGFGLVNLIKKYSEFTWISTETLPEIEKEWECTYSDAVEQNKIQLMYYSESTDANIVIGSLDLVENNFWIYCYHNLDFMQMNDDFFDQYFGKTIRKLQAQKILEGLLQEEIYAYEKADIIKECDEREEFEDIFIIYCKNIANTNIEINRDTHNFMQQVADVEEKMQICFPDELKQWFLLIENVNFMINGFLVGLNVYSLADMYKEWKQWREFDSNTELNYFEYYSSFPIESIKRRYTNPGWIPLAHDGYSNYIGVDLDPDRKGVFGQVINFGRDENDKTVLAKSIKSFLVILTNLQKEMVIIKTKQNSLYINSDDEHPISWLKTKILT